MENDARHRTSPRASVLPTDDESEKIGVDLKLCFGLEVIEVRLDAFGIHFSHEDGGAQGHLPWDTALAMSLLPPGVRRTEAVSVA